MTSFTRLLVWAMLPITLLIKISNALQIMPQKNIPYDILFIFDVSIDVCIYYDSTGLDLFREITNGLSELEYNDVKYSAVTAGQRQVLLTDFVSNTDVIQNAMKELECHYPLSYGHELATLGSLAEINQPQNVFGGEYCNNDKDCRLNWRKNSKKLIVYFAPENEVQIKSYITDFVRKTAPKNIGIQLPGDQYFSFFAQKTINDYYKKYDNVTIPTLKNFTSNVVTQEKRNLIKKIAQTEHYYDMDPFKTYTNVYNQVEAVAESILASKISVIIIHNKSNYRCGTEYESDFYNLINENVRRPIIYSEKLNPHVRKIPKGPVCLSALQYAMGSDLSLIVDDASDRLLLQKSVDILKDTLLSRNLLYKVIEGGQFMAVLNMETLTSKKSLQLPKPLSNSIIYWVLNALSPIKYVSDDGNNDDALDIFDFGTYNYEPIHISPVFLNQNVIENIDKSSLGYYRYPTQEEIDSLIYSEENEKKDDLKNLHFVKIYTIDDLKHNLSLAVKNYHYLNHIFKTKALKILHYFYSYALHNINYFGVLSSESLIFKEINSSYYFLEPAVVVDISNLFDKSYTPIWDKVAEYYNTNACHHVIILFMAKFDSFFNDLRYPEASIELIIKSGCDTQGLEIESCCEASPYYFPFTILKHVNYLRTININNMVDMVDEEIDDIIRISTIPNEYSSTPNGYSHYPYSLIDACSDHLTKNFVKYASDVFINLPKNGTEYLVDTNVSYNLEGLQKYVNFFAKKHDNKEILKTNTNNDVERLNHNISVEDTVFSSSL